MKGSGFLLLLGAAMGLSFLGGTVRLLQSAPAPNAPACDDAVSSHGLQWLGTASCATSGCHHDNGPRGCRGSEYTTWITWDPHARAYAVLYDPLSRDIVTRLYGSQEKPASEQQLCLSCHASSPPEKERGPRFSVIDGIGCESCHGPAEKWIAEHAQPAWQDRSDADKERQGMRPLHDLGVRYRMCVECHVGCGERDVNHDLIAAGHPRLRFEAALFTERMPHHWPAEKAPSFEALSWATGQVLAARTELNLLAYRADAAAAQRKPWPEFAAYDCASCHHLPRWKTTASEEEVTPGRLRLETWYCDMLPALTDGNAQATAIQQKMDQLRRLLKEPFPDAKQVSALARAAAADLEAVPADQKVQKGEEIRSLLHRLSQDRPLTEDQAGQHYLALFALNRSLTRLESRQEKPACREALTNLGRAAFPRGLLLLAGQDTTWFREQLGVVRSQCGW